MQGDLEITQKQYEAAAIHICNMHDVKCGSEAYYHARLFLAALDIWPEYKPDQPYENMSIF
jgi:hypothetical protein